ncbi:AarF/UbiB family protein [Thauera sinica]|uniref:AarF/UbiB family protein n=1 Tax=Thauera sinica TaxID=2665146 RepID=A0ABW1ANX3_9RHOO|nr:AarF/UbiB family protein [Thauera sp. K11]ATE61983.1 hypothetical protein CCZ27_20215 [Thauera sp. K11]
MTFDTPPAAFAGASDTATGYDDLFGAIGLHDLVPASLAAWRPLLAEALAFFLERLPEERLAALLAEQFAAADAPAAARAAALLAHCPTLHKLGQVVARHHELDPELRRHLQQLESMPSTLPVAPLVQRIRAQSGTGARLQIADAALAEGSVAVVLPFAWWEDGRLRDGVFKVLKPRVAEHLAQELAVLPALAAFLAARGARLGLPAIDYHGHLASVQRLLTQEIRLDVEQANMRAAAALLADDGAVFVPRLLPWCSAGVTAMERVHGGRVNDAALPAARRRMLGHEMVGALLARPFWSQADPAIFHGDLHGGNLLLADDGRLAVLDWSLTARLAKAEREAVVAIALGAMALDEKQIRDGLARLGMRDAGCPQAERTVAQALDALVRSARPVGFDWLVGLLDRLALQGATGFGAELAVFRKSWLSLAGVLRDLDTGPAADLPLVSIGLQRFFAEMPARMLSRADSRAFSTHVSTADLIALAGAAWPAGMRYWSRLLGNA